MMHASRQSPGTDDEGESCPGNTTCPLSSDITTGESSADTMHDENLAAEHPPDMQMLCSRVGTHNNKSSHVLLNVERTDLAQEWHSPQIRRVARRIQPGLGAAGCTPAASAWLVCQSTETRQTFERPLDRPRRLCDCLAVRHRCGAALAPGAHFSAHKPTT